MSTSSAPVFVARDLTKVYTMGDVQVHALRGVDFDLSAGEFVVLLGPSGSGKTTLLNMIGALDTPTAGRVVVGGRDITRAARNVNRRASQLAGDVAAQVVPAVAKRALGRAFDSAVASVGKPAARKR